MDAEVKSGVSGILSSWTRRASDLTSSPGLPRHVYIASPVLGPGDLSVLAGVGVEGCTESDDVGDARMGSVSKTLSLAPRTSLYVHGGAAPILFLCLSCNAGNSASDKSGTSVASEASEFIVIRCESGEEGVWEEGKA